MIEPPWIDIKNNRDLDFFLWKHSNDIAIFNYITAQNRSYSYDDIFRMKPKLAVLAINEAYKLCYLDSEIHRLHAKELTKMQKLQLPLKEFDWLKSCHNACYFAWISIRTYGNKNHEIETYIYHEDCFFYPRTQYYYLGCELFPENHRSRVESIIAFFDRCTMNFQSKTELIRKIKLEWHERSRTVRKLPLKSNEKKKTQWTWEYINKNKGLVVHGHRKREIHAQLERINEMGNRLYSKIILTEKLSEEIEREFTIAGRDKLTGVHSDMYSLRKQLAAEINNKKSMEVVRKRHLHSPSFLSFFMPASPGEMYLSLVCIYNFLYYKDLNFIPRLSKAWEAHSYRKTKKKNIGLHVKSKNHAELISDELINIKLDELVDAAIETEKELKREKAKEIINEILRNAPTHSEKQDNDPLLDSDANPWFG